MYSGKTWQKLHVIYSYVFRFKYLRVIIHQQEIARNFCEYCIANNHGKLSALDETAAIRRLGICK